MFTLSPPFTSMSEIGILVACDLDVYFCTISLAASTWDAVTALKKAQNKTKQRKAKQKNSTKLRSPYLEDWIHSHQTNMSCWTWVQLIILAGSKFTTSNINEKKKCKEQTWRSWEIFHSASLSHTQCWWTGPSLGITMVYALRLDPSDFCTIGVHSLHELSHLHRCNYLVYVFTMSYTVVSSLSFSPCGIVFICSCVWLGGDVCVCVCVGGVHKCEIVNIMDGTMPVVCKIFASSVYTCPQPLCVYTNS